MMLLFIAIAVASCGGDDDPASSEVVGTWYGTRVYYNPVSGKKYQYLTISFESNGTGDLEYEAPTSYTAANFTYKVKNGSVICSGASANTSGDVSSDFTMTLNIEGERLIPTDHYTQFILTRDNSVMTDGNGHEVVDWSSWLQHVWVATDGSTVVVFDDDTYDEYILTSPFAKTYSSHSSGRYTCDPSIRLLTIGGTQLEVLSIGDNFLSLIRKYDNEWLQYNRGSESDIPTRY